MQVAGRIRAAEALPIAALLYNVLATPCMYFLCFQVHYLIGGSSEQDQKFFLQSYSKLAEVTPLLFYILLTVCIVSVLDR